MDSIEPNSNHFQQRSKPDFSDQNASVRLAAVGILRNPLNLADRKPINGYAIDSAAPDELMERDDAVNVEYRNDPKHGRVTVLHVTIADVAAASPAVAAGSGGHRLAALDDYVAAKGETLYFSHGSAPMFPASLHNYLSLENRKERAGLTISITFDDHARPVHTEFSRTRITTECRSYLDAAADIRQHGHPIQQIAVLAERLLKRKEDATSLPHYDTRTGTYTDLEGEERYVSPGQLSSYRTVQGCMMAANEAVPKVMQGSNFLFRNHYAEKPPEYSSKAMGHYGMDLPIYSHVTSPIRRYVDLVNQRMMHWAIDVVDALTDSIVQSGTPLSEDQVRSIVWDHAPKLLEKASHYKQGYTPGKNSTKTQLRHELEMVIREVINNPAIEPDSAIAPIVRSAIIGIQATQMPYSAQDTDRIAQGLNTILEKHRADRRKLVASALDLEEFFPDTTPEKINSLSVTGFMYLLDAAAQRGDNNDVFAGEVKRRITMAIEALKRKNPDEQPDQLDRQTSLENAELRALAPNLHSILVVAESHKDGHWEELKHFAFQQLKAYPELAEELFELMQDEQRHPPMLIAPPAECEEAKQLQKKEAKTTYIAEANLFDSQGHPYPAALVVLSHNRTALDEDGHVLSQEKQDYSAPIIDTVDPQKYDSLEEARTMARRAAIVTFFRYYGKLKPHDTLYTPPLIELELERVKIQKGGYFSFLKKICENRFDVKCDTRPLSAHEDNRTVIATLRITPKAGGETIVRQASAGENKAFDRAAKAILYDRQFRDMLALSYEPVEKPDIKTQDDDLPAMGWGQLLQWQRGQLAQAELQR